MQPCFLAVDIGASSGRHIVGTVQDGKIALQEVYRFENGVRRENGHLCWNIDALVAEVVNGLKAAHDAGYTPATIGIDTWAVDFVLLDADGQRIGDAVAYRDERTEGVRELLERDYGLTFAEHYVRTGIQYQKFNTVYQLMALKKEHPEQLAAAKTFLMVPDYLNYLLCGVAANEYTNASTTALVGADSRDWDDALIAQLGLPRSIFQPIKTAGTVLGHLTPEVRAKVGFDAEVILPATHDTGSAFLAVPARDEYAAYLSSGTWSLLGVENGTMFSPLFTYFECVWLALLLLALAGCLAACRLIGAGREADWLFVAMLAVFGFMLFQMIFEAGNRFFMIYTPFVVLLAVGGLRAMGRAAGRRRRA